MCDVEGMWQEVKQYSVWTDAKANARKKTIRSVELLRLKVKYSLLEKALCCRYTSFGCRSEIKVHLHKNARTPPPHSCREVPQS